MSGNEIDLDICVRVHTRVVSDASDEPGRQSEPLPQWAKHALVIDCETGTGLGQKLNFGFACWTELVDGRHICKEEIIFNRFLCAVHEEVPGCERLILIAD